MWRWVELSVVEVTSVAQLARLREAHRYGGPIALYLCRTTLDLCSTGAL